MRAMIFCAGFGTRMRPLTDTLPKPALPLHGRPLIAHVLAWLQPQGVDSAVINLHHLADVMRETAERACPPGMDLIFSEEPEILGTGGGLVAARQHLEGHDEVIVVNGDIYTDLDLAPALSLHRRHRPSSTLVLTDDPAHAPLFGVGLDAADRITDFWGAPWGDRAVRHCAYTGIQILDPTFIATLPPSGFACVKESGWIPLLERGGDLRGAVVRGTWFDVGTPDRYRAARRSPG